MSVPNTYELEHEVLPQIRKQIVYVEDIATRNVLFSLLGLVHDLAAELARTEQR